MTFFSCLLFILLWPYPATSSERLDSQLQDVASNATEASAGVVAMATLRPLAHGRPASSQQWNTSGQNPSQGKPKVKPFKLRPPTVNRTRGIPSEMIPSGHTTNLTKRQGRRCNQQAPPPSRCDITEDDDVKTVLTSSSQPGDLLDESDIYELVSLGGAKTMNKKLNKKLKAHLRVIVKSGLVSRRAYKLFRKVIMVLSLPLMVVGLVTNVMAARVFRRLARNVTNTYMTCLVLLDIAYLLLMLIVGLLVVSLRLRLQSTSRYFMYAYVAYKFLILSLRQVIVSVTAFMSVDRYLVISSPLAKRRLLVSRRPCLLIGAATLLVLAFNSHQLLTWEVRSGRMAGTNGTVWFLSPSPLYARHRQLLQDVSIVGSGLFQYCPLLVVLLANVALIVSLRRYSRRVSSQGGEETRVVGRSCTSGMAACGTFGAAGMTRTNDAGSDVVGARAGTGLGSGTGTGKGLGSGTGTGMGSGIGTGIGTESRLGIETELHMGIGTGTETGAGTGLGTETGAAKSTRTGTVSKAKTGTRTEAGSGSGSKQFFQLERRKCVTVITYSLLFFLLALPLALLPLLRKVAPEFNSYRSQHYLYLTYVRCHPFLDLLSASVNFFVFFIKGGAFRAQVRSMVRCERRGPRAGTFHLRTSAQDRVGELRQRPPAGSPSRPSVVLRGNVRLGNS